MNCLHCVRNVIGVICTVTWSPSVVIAATDAELLAPLLPVERIATEQDILAPLVKLPSTADSAMPLADSSDFQGFQIRPPHGLLKVKQSLPLAVKYCFSPTGNQDVVLTYSCDEKSAELHPLIPTHNVFNWSVNGITGGNSRLGRVVAGAKGEAIYTAPHAKPDTATVAISAEVVIDKDRKEMVVANVTLLDDQQTYYGTLSITATSSEISYKASGEIALLQNAAGSRGYTAVGGWLEVLYRVKGCAPFMGSIALYGELEMDVPDDDHHQITLGTDAFEVSCNGINIPQGLLMTLHPCEPGTGGTKARELTGAAKCDGVNYTWQLTKQ